MIVCVTPNVALDRTITVSEFKDRGVYRTGTPLIAAGGKGINVARTIKILGGDSLCAGFLGGYTGQQIKDLMQAEDLASDWTWITGETRTGVIVVEPDEGRTLVLNEPGPVIQVSEWAQFCQDIRKLAESAQSLTFSGSVPPGIKPDQYQTLLSDLVAEGHQVWVDTSGAMLSQISQIAGIYLKINHEEAGELFNMSIQNRTAAIRAMQLIYQRTQTLAAMTMGAQGAFLTDGESVFMARPPRLNTVSAVGSGDAFLAGLVLHWLAHPADLRGALRQAIAAGSANALSTGGGLLQMTDFERLRDAVIVEQVG